MPMEGQGELYINGGGRAQSIYQPSSGEKHVLFYPTSPAPSVTSDERRSWSQASSSFPNAHTQDTQLQNKYVTNHKPSNNNSESTRMRKSEGVSVSAAQGSGGGGPSSGDIRQDSKYNFKIGIYGWRKRCLYILVLGLLIMVIVNLALTLWVLKVMEFSSEGMGQLRIVTGGIQLNGRALVLDALIASSIRSRTGQPIVIESSRNLTLLTRNEDGVLDNRIFLGNDRFECLASSFKVLDDRGSVLFAADRKEVFLGAHLLRVSGEGGAVFDGSIQTPLVRAESGHNLRLESPTRSLEIRAPLSVHLDSRAGDIKATSLTDIKLKSTAGNIRLETESGSVLMPGLPTAIPTTRAQSSHTHEVFQLCVCSSGKLFLAPPHAICATEENSRVCR